MPRTPPGTRADYAAFVPVATRWRDNDAYGHMNNAVYIEIFDTALSLWQIQAGLAIDAEDGPRLVIAESGCRYHAELRFPDPLDIGLRIPHLGRRSFTVELGMFRGTEDHAAAEGFFVQVRVAPDGSAAMPLGEALTARLAPLHMPRD